MKRETKLTIRINGDDLAMLRLVCEDHKSSMSELIRGYISEIISPYKAKFLRGMAQSRDGPLEEGPPQSNLSIVESNNSQKGEQ